MTTVVVEEIKRVATLYRIGSPSGEGLWYNQSGFSTGLAQKHELAASALPMGRHPIFSDGGFKWISTANSRETLANWFTPEEVVRLARNGYRLEVITVSAYRTLTFTDYGYSHQVYRPEDLIRIDYFDHACLHLEAA